MIRSYVENAFYNKEVSSLDGEFSREKIEVAYEKGRFGLFEKENKLWQQVMLRGV